MRLRNHGVLPPRHAFKSSLSTCISFSLDWLDSGPSRTFPLSFLFASVFYHNIQVTETDAVRPLQAQLPYYTFSKANPRHQSQQILAASI